MQGGILSCASCRQRKLKCDRNEPCSNCVTRNVECKYASAPRGRVPMQRQDGNQKLEARLRHLEQLIGTLAAQRSSSGESHSTTSSRDLSDTRISDNFILRSSPSGKPSGKPSGFDSAVNEVKTGRIVENNSQVTYVSSDHWAAIQSEIAKVREYVELENSPDRPDVAEQMSHGGPVILEGTCEPSMDDILSDIPPRAIADRLVSRYFNSTEPSIVAIHAPTFQKEYKQFWLDQSNASQPWIALLFGIMFMGTFLYVRSEDDLPESFGDPVIIMDAFRRHAAECLLLSKYSTQPTTYTLEALLSNIQCEFVRQPDAHLGVWVLSSVATRLAMRMGYHRDPGNYKQISPFQGEMRRRVWAIIVQLDTLTSCQLGLPSMIHGPQCDTELPRNLHNEDFNDNSVALPPPRPETELTPILYTISKARLLAVFGAIFNQICLVRLERYEEVMTLDGRLHQTYTSIPPCLRIANLEDCITVSPDLLIKRYHLELLYHKARCILHRHHMTKAYQNSDFEYSKVSCLDAAMMLLMHQENIFNEVQPGGILFRDKWFLSSLEQHDFLLASMIICLELSSRPGEHVPGAAQVGKHSPPKYSKEQLINAVRSSRRFWGEFKSRSVEALQGFWVLSVLLDKVAGSPETQGSQDVFATPPSKSRDGDRSLYNSDQGHLYGSTDTQMLQAGTEETQAAHLGFNPRLEEIGGMLNSPDLVDWDLWEAYIQNSRSEMEP